MVKARILVIQDTIKEQFDEAIGHGYDGMIFYAEQTGKSSQYLGLGLHNRESEIPAKPKTLFKIANISKLADVVSVSNLQCFILNFQTLWYFRPSKKQESLN